MENNQLLISVIIPVYNSEKYLERCLQSVLQQTHSNIEVILVDDGSTDRSGEICDEFCQKNDRIKVVHKTNGGQAQARNRGLDIAQGEYIGFMDNDDTIDSRMYEILLENALRNDVMVSGCSTMMIYPNGEKVNHFDKVESGIKHGKDLILNVLYQNKFSWGTVWNKIFHKSLKEDLYFQEGKELEDYDVILRLFDKVGKIHFEQKPMYHWYQYNSSQSKRGFHKNKLTCLEMIDSLQQYFRRDVVADEEILQALDYFEFVVRYRILNEMWQSNSAEVHKKIGEQLQGIKKFVPIMLKSPKCNITIYKYLIKLFMFQFMVMIRRNQYS